MVIKRYDLGLETFVAEREKLVAAAYRIVDNRAIAEELVQESWLRWPGKQYPAEHPLSLLHRIVRNLSVDWYRRQRIEFDAIESQMLLYDAPPDAERVVTARQQLERVIRVIQHLPPKARLAFRYSRIEGLTLKKTGERLGVSESRASQLVSDAIIRIVEVLED